MKCAERMFPANHVAFLLVQYLRKRNLHPEETSAGNRSGFICAQACLYPIEASSGSLISGSYQEGT